MKIQEITNPNNIKNFFEGYYHYLQSNNPLHKPHIQEQAQYRAFLCVDCLANGKCAHCGCKTPQMFFSPSKVDSQGRWGKMLSPAEWKKFKESSPQYKIFERSFKQFKENRDGSTKQLRDKLKFLGHEPPARDPLQGLPQERQDKSSPGKLENNVGDSSSLPSGVEVQESLDSGEETNR